MKLLCGVSVQAKGFRSTGPRYFTFTVSELTGEVSSSEAVIVTNKQRIYAPVGPCATSMTWRSVPTVMTIV
jgi:hypothetical protein